MEYDRKNFLEERRKSLANVMILESPQKVKQFRYHKRRKQYEFLKLIPSYQSRALCAMCTCCYFAISKSLSLLFLRSDSDLMKILDRQNIRRDKMDFLRVYDNTMHRTKVSSSNHIIFKESSQI